MPASPRPKSKTNAARKPVERKSAARPAARRATPTRARKSSGSTSTRAPSRTWNWTRLSLDRKLDILGVVLALVGLLTLLSLFSPQHGALTGWWVMFVNRLAGWGSFILPAAFTLIGVWLVLRNVERLPMLSAERLTGIILLYLNILAWMHLAAGGGWAAAEAGLGGGYLGGFFEQITVGALGQAGAVVAFSAWLVIALAMSLDISVSEIFQFFQNILASLVRRANTRITSERQIYQEKQERKAQQGAHMIPELDSSGQPRDPNAQIEASDLPSDFQPLHPGQSGATVPLPANVRNRPLTNRADSPSGAHAVSGTSASGASGVTVSHTPAAPLPPWKTPAIADILDPSVEETVKTNVDGERGKLIEETLASFGTPVRVVEVHRGPTITQFGVEPLYTETRNARTRVRVSKIVALADDLALALAAPRIRIQAPVPGRNYVGIEVPNIEVSRVLLRDVMESDAFRKSKSPLRLALGKDVSGFPKVTGLDAMPHLLIAGTTGAGKSVLVNAILSCLLLNNTPTELRMILVDPKRVELTGYNGIPHLLAPVVVEAEQVVGALQWVQREMDARYHRFSQVGARNISDYNAHNTPPLPYMLVLIDELADLMMLAPDETERALTRLAQLARATGIHLILATQRPSVDVVTGLIKANFPARVAFAVASGTDSRVILDQPGAERLLGRGDMLFQAPDAPAPVRLQGVYVSDAEIQRLVEYWRQQAYDLRDVNLHTPTATPVNMDMPLNAPLRQSYLFGGESERAGDPIMPEAIKVVRGEGKASISMLQRKLRIGYTRSARLIEQLEEQGIIGPALATSQVREVLPTAQENDAEAQDSLTSS